MGPIRGGRSEGGRSEGGRSEDHTEETYTACEDQAPHGAHQEYGPDGNYDDSYYAMSTSAEYTHSNDYLYEEDDEETYAS